MRSRWRSSGGLAGVRGFVQVFAGFQLRNPRSATWRRETPCYPFARRRLRAPVTLETSTFRTRPRRSSLRRSSVVERAAVNRLVVSSNLTAGANSQMVLIPSNRCPVSVSVDWLSTRSGEHPHKSDRERNERHRDHRHEADGRDNNDSEGEQQFVHVLSRCRSHALRSSFRRLNMRSPSLRQPCKDTRAGAPGTAWS